MRKSILWLLVMLLVTGGTAFSQNKAELKAQIVIDSNHGWPTKILITGNNPNKKAWLGISLYPYGIVDTQSGGRHSFIELQKGEFSHVIQVDTQLLGGSFEVGLWGTQVDKVDCTIDNCYWCKVNGFHFDDNLAYRSGLLTRLSGYK